MKNTSSNVWEQLTYLEAHEKVASMFRGERSRRRQLDALIESMYDPSNDDELFQMIQNDPDHQLMLMYLNDPHYRMMLDSLL